jgi:hypothetical protein
VRTVDGATRPRVLGAPALPGGLALPWRLAPLARLALVAPLVARLAPVARGVARALVARLARLGHPRSPRRRAVVARLALLVLFVLASPAAATHAPDHRFIVVGYVTDAAGQPVADAPVLVTRLKTGLQHRTRTERDGFYMVVVHIHDEDEGERLAVSARGVRGEVVARFDIYDKRVERGTRADIVGDHLVEDRRAFAETLRAYLAR